VSVNRYFYGFQGLPASLDALSACATNFGKAESIKVQTVIRSTHAVILHFAAEGNLRMADDAQLFHRLAKFCRLYGLLHQRRGVPGAKNREAIWIIVAAADLKAFFSLRFAPRFRVLFRRILRKYGYPPDKREKAT
jgi:hypothetical protein